MFKVLHQGEAIGQSSLESGDPDEFSVSGVFHNVGGPKALSRWLMSVGGTEDDGVTFIEMDGDYKLVDKEDQPISFGEGTLIAVPDQDEAFVDISGVPEDVYNTHFSHHRDALSSEGSPSEDSPSEDSPSED